MTVVRPAPEGGLQPEQAVRALCREALSLRSALEMDCWISSLLGQIWEQRGAAPPVQELDRTFALGAPMMEQIARYGGPGARLTLHAVASVDRGGLGVRCGQLAQELSRQRLPRWARHARPGDALRGADRDGPGRRGGDLPAGVRRRSDHAHGVGVRRPSPGRDRQAHRAAGADRRLGGRGVRTRRGSWARRACEYRRRGRASASSRRSGAPTSASIRSSVRRSSSCGRSRWREPVRTPERAPTPPGSTERRRAP